MLNFKEWNESTKSTKSTNTKGTYVGMRVKNFDELKEWFKEVPNLVNSMHVTIAYSRKHFDYEPSNETIVIKPNSIKGFDLFGPDKNILVMKLISNELQEKHNKTLELGAAYDYPSYEPHITISYDYKGKESSIKYIKIPDFDIQICCEYVEELDESWKDE